MSDYINVIRKDVSEEFDILYKQITDICHTEEKLDRPFSAVELLHGLQDVRYYADKYKHSLNQLSHKLLNLEQHAS